MNDDNAAQPSAADVRAARIARVVIAVATCLGALGMAALLYFPLQYLQR